MTVLGTFPRSWKVFREAMMAWFNEKLWIKSRLMSHLGIPAEKVLFVDHHTAHAASAFFCSPFKEAAILTVDGVGEWTTGTMGGLQRTGRTRSERYQADQEMRFPHPLGSCIRPLPHCLAFEVNEGEYKVMGMAPYGHPLYLDKVYKC